MCIKIFHFAIVTQSHKFLSIDETFFSFNWGSQQQEEEEEGRFFKKKRTKENRIQETVFNDEIFAVYELTIILRVTRGREKIQSVRSYILKGKVLFYILLLLL